MWQCARCTLPVNKRKKGNEAACGIHAASLLLSPREESLRREKKRRRLRCTPPCHGYCRRRGRRGRHVGFMPAPSTTLRQQEGVGTRGHVCAILPPCRRQELGGTTTYSVVVPCPYIPPCQSQKLQATTTTCSSSSSSSPCSSSSSLRVSAANYSLPTPAAGPFGSDVALGCRRWLTVTWRRGCGR